MVFDYLSAGLGLVAVLVLALRFSIFSRGRWLTGWLRGMFGLLLMALAAACGLVAWDLKNYRELLQDEPIATITFTLVEPNTFNAALHIEGIPTAYEYLLKGDQWQIDAKILRWKGRMQQFGGKPGYRLDRISGRYLSIEEERTRERTVYPVNPTEYGIDVWQWAHDFKSRIPVVEASYGSAIYMPMADGATYEIALSFSGLVARPLNSVAREAVFLWN